MTQLVCFLDLETTGHDDERDPRASVLEVGMSLTTDAPDFPEVGFAEQVIRPPGGDVARDQLWAAMPPVVQDMHRASGLWTLVWSSGVDVASADVALASWLARSVVRLGHEGPLPFAGSGVGPYDLRWTRAHLPRVAALLTYWCLDVSPVRRLAQRANPGLAASVAARVEKRAVEEGGFPQHRALADARRSRVEAEEWVAVLRAQG